MLKKFLFVFICILSFNSIANTVSQSITNELIIAKNSDSHINENIENNKNTKLSKISAIVSVSMILVFTLLTIALLKIISSRAKTNKLLQETNNELLLAKEKAEKANLAKAKFLSTITHELRTPLYAVTGLTHLLLEGKPTEEQKEHLNSLRFSGEYLLSLINNILDLNKLEAKKTDIESVVFDLKKRITDVIIALDKAAVSQNNKLVFDFDENIPKKIKGDPLKISQILINLIGNAIKFTTNGTINVRVKLIEEQLKAKKIKLLFEIEDNGIGISENKIETIFDSFSQESSQINKKFGGTGLGLSIVKNLLILLNSKIELKSSKGNGSTFYFDLNFDSYNEEEDKHLPIEVKETNFEFLKGKKVLIVEDNKINRVVTRKVLNNHNAITDIAENGETAVAKAKEIKYDLILMDIHMPGISGVEASKRIRLFDMSTPIIALTAVTLSDHIDEFYANGINDVIPKPYKIDDFFNTIERNFAEVY